MTEQELLDTVADAGLELTERLLNLLLSKIIEVAVELEGHNVVSVETLTGLIGAMISGLDKAKSG